MKSHLTFIVSIINMLKTLVFVNLIVTNVGYTKGVKN